MANQHTVKKPEVKKSGKERYLEAKRLVEGGMGIKDASAKVGMAHSMYTYYKQRENPRPKAPVAIPETQSQMIMIVGSPSQIAPRAS